MHQLQHLQNNFPTILRASIQRTWSEDHTHIDLEALVVEAEQLNQQFTEIGEASYQVIGEPSEELTEAERFEAAWINYEWANKAKAFLILWRDILFQTQKALIFQNDGLVNAEKVQQLCQAAYAKTKEVKADFLATIDRATKTTERKRKRQNATWNLQQNPWPTYKIQLQEVPKQCERLQEDFQKLLTVATHFHNIENLVQQTEDFCRQEITNVQSIAQKTIAEIDQETTPKLGKIVHQLEELEAGISLPNHFSSFTVELDKEINGIVEELAAPVSTEGGMVELKEIPFKKSTKQWLDAEILPLLYEVWEVTENTHNGLKMALINIKNRALLLNAEEKEGKTASLSTVNSPTIYQPLSVFQKNVEQAELSLTNLSALIDERIERDFNVSEIYKETRNFLPIPLQAATLNQFKKGQNEVQGRFFKWFDRLWSKVKVFQANVEIEDTLSDSERIVRLIQSRMGASDNSNYSSIFLTKGFIGESFAVGRKRELNHARLLIDNWKKGFRGAAVITGKRFSGKTILGELIASHFFDGNTIRLSPNTLIKLNGRKLMTDFDLEKALNFIVKYVDGKRPLIWIDDMELWWDNDLPLSQNVRTLRKFIDGHSSHLFFLVSMSNWLKTQLNLFHETSKVFQAEINVDKMSLDEIRESIMIRHGATHKKLLNVEGEALSGLAFSKLINKIYRSTNGNIGEVLNRWSCSTVKIDEDHVRHQMATNYSLPNFVTPDIAILLTAIMMEKRTNEYRLRKLFGPAFTDKYAPILQRQISIGVLKRQLDGWLEINEVIANDLGVLLEEQGYLKYHR